VLIFKYSVANMKQSESLSGFQLDNCK